MPQSFSKRGSATYTGSAEVTEGSHMRFAEYATRILALLQEDGKGKGETSTRYIIKKSNTSNLIQITLQDKVYYEVYNTF